MKQQETFREDVAAGRNAVMELLKSGKEIDAIYVRQGPAEGSLKAILAKAKERGVAVKQVSGDKLDQLSGGVNHQGVAAVLPAVEYTTLEEILRRAQEKGRPPFLVLCDEIQDPHNLGAILRTAEACGVDGVILPKRRSVGLTQTVYKTSAGAAAVVPVCRVSNLAQTVRSLKKQGIFFYCAQMGGTDWCQADYTGGACLIVGNEGKGVNRLLLEEADVLVGLPMLGQVNSLNASVAAGVLLYEMTRQRLGKSAKNPGERR